ncbi:MAG: DUF1844 domain-containing protein [Terriglobales bacterium]|jgi:hypothetical protein
MAKHKEPEFTVTDKRRRYDEDGSAQEESPAPASPGAASEQETPAPEQPSSETGYVEQQFTGNPESATAPPPPTQAEQDAQHADYRASNQKLDNLLRERAGSKAPPEAKSFEMTFERLVASLYMTAMMQLGMMAPEGEQPRADILGARQTIDTLSLLGEKTKGNLTEAEQNMLHNVLFEARMAYLQLTNAITQGPPPTGGLAK